MRVIIGKNPIFEALKSDNKIERIFVAAKENKHSFVEIFDIANEKGIQIQEVDRKKLDSLSPGGTHQGIVAIIEDFKYSTIEDVVESARSKEQKPFLLLLDGITDVHNLGAIIRSAECAGVHGVVIPERRAAQITDTTAKTSAGALEYMPVVQVKNLNATIQELKKMGFWIYGADMDGDSLYYNESYNDSVAIVIGSEGKGISRLVRENCDTIIEIPLKGKINSLNASCAASIIMFEVTKKRG